MKVRKSKLFNTIEFKDGKIKPKFKTTKKFIEQYDEITPFLVRKGDTIEIIFTANNKNDDNNK